MIGIVYNPVSGSGCGEELAQQAAHIFEEKGMPIRLYKSCCTGGITEQTKRALLDGCDSVACVGGDGSLSEAVSVMAGQTQTLYIVPCGTGNDFVRSLHFPEDALEALRLQLRSEVSAVDCGVLNGRAFINVSGSGFDVCVLERTEALKEQYSGREAYRRAVLDMLRHFSPFRPEIWIDGAKLPERGYTIVEVANGRYFGGGMRVAPDASVDDGLLEVILIRSVPRKCIPLLLPIFILGLHTRIPVAIRYRAKTVRMRSDHMVVNIDGRLEHIDDVTYTILPGGLRIRRPQTRAR